MLKPIKDASYNEVNSFNLLYQKNGEWFVGRTIHHRFHSLSFKFVSVSRDNDLLQGYRDKHDAISCLPSDKLFVCDDFSEVIAK